MEMRIVEKIIRLHLNGKSVREIEAETGVSKSTVEDVINRWRTGDHGIFQEAISIEQGVINLNLYLKESGSSVPKLKSMALMEQTLHFIIVV